MIGSCVHCHATISTLDEFAAHIRCDPKGVYKPGQRGRVYSETARREAAATVKQQ